jgi:hypothetical protein
MSRILRSTGCINDNMVCVLFVFVVFVFADADADADAAVDVDVDVDVDAAVVVENLVAVDDHIDDDIYLYDGV